jgi:hypothetical protein
VNNNKWIVCQFCYQEMRDLFENLSEQRVGGLNVGDEVSISYIKGQINAYSKVHKLIGNLYHKNMIYLLKKMREPCTGSTRKTIDDAIKHLKNISK